MFQSNFVIRRSGGLRRAGRIRTRGRVVAGAVLDDRAQGLEETVFDAVVGVVEAEICLVLRLEFVVGHEEEQPVAEDRAAERKAVLFIVDGTRIELAVAVKLVADPAVLDRVVVGIAREFVRARLDRQVDEAAREVRRDDVVVSRDDAGRLDGVEVDRRTRGCIGAVAETEVVLLQRAVNREAVEAGVDTSDREVAVVAVGLGERVAQQRANDVTIRCRHVDDVFRPVG